MCLFTLSENFKVKIMDAILRMLMWWLNLFSANKMSDTHWRCSALLYYMWTPMGPLCGSNLEFHHMHIVNNYIFLVLHNCWLHSFICRSILSTDVLLLTVCSSRLNLTRHNIKYKVMTQVSHGLPKFIQRIMCTTTTWHLTYRQPKWLPQAHGTCLGRMSVNYCIIFKQ